MTMRFVAFALALCCAACAADPTPPGLAIEADAEAVRRVGQALRGMKAPRLAALGRALEPCAQGARLRSPTADVDALPQAVSCAAVDGPGLRGTWRADGDVWRFNLDGGALLLAPPAGSLLAPASGDVIGFRADGALFAVAWATRPDAIAKTFKGDLTAALISPLLDGTFAVIGFPGPTPSDFPQLAARFGVESLPTTVIDRLAEDAAQRLGTAVVRSGEGENLRWCLENLAVVPGLSPCVQAGSNGVIAAFNERTLEQALKALAPAAPARIDVDLTALDDNDRRRELEPMGWPFAKLTASPAGDRVRITVGP
jgi:hypothetical protein